MSEPPKTIWRVLAYSSLQKKAAFRYFTSLEQAQREGAAGADIQRYDLTAS